MSVVARPICIIISNYIRLAKAGYERWDARAAYAAYRYEHSQQINDQARFWRGTRTAEQKPDHDVPVNRQALFMVLSPAKKDR